MEATIEAPVAPVASQNPPTTPTPQQEVKTPPSSTVEGKNSIPSPLDELDALAGISQKEVEKKAEEPKKEVAPSQDADKKDVEKKDEQASEKKEGDEPKPAGTAKELRAALDSQKKLVQQLKAENEALKKGKPAADDPEKKSLLDRVRQEEERRKTLEKELGVVSYQKSEEYKKKYEQPLEAAFSEATRDVAQLTVIDAEGTERPATAKDFQAILHIPNVKDAMAKAKEVFGEAAPYVMSHYSNIWRMERSRVDALANHEKNQAETEAAQKIEMEKQAQQAKELWESKKTELVEKYPTFFAPEEGDDEGNEALQKGYEFADFVISNPKDLPMDKKIEYSAVLRNKAAGFDRLALKLKKSSDRIAELEKELEGFKASVPGPSEGKSEPVADPANWAAELDKLATVGK